MGLIGMLMGWWQVKLSSGCPLPGGRGWSADARTVARDAEARMRPLLRTGTGALLVVPIMFIGSLGAVGGHAAAVAVGGLADPGRHAVAGHGAGGGVLRRRAHGHRGWRRCCRELSDVYRANCVARGLDDPGHVVLEGVLVVSAGLTIAAFVIWFFFLAGASPVPIGIHV